MYLAISNTKKVLIRIFHLGKLHQNLLSQFLIKEVKFMTLLDEKTKELHFMSLINFSVAKMSTSLMKTAGGLYTLRRSKDLMKLLDSF